MHDGTFKGESSLLCFERDISFALVYFNVCIFAQAIAVISALLQRGADVRYKEKYGRTALHIW